VPAPEQSLRWRVRGPGIQGALGVLYQPSDAWQLAATWKTPGQIFMEGSVGVAGARQDLSFHLDIPQQAIVGAAWRPVPRVLLTVFGSWSDTSAFERSRFEFHDTPALNFDFAPEAHDTFRYGAGIEWEARERLFLRAGLARGQNALGPRSVTPLLYDMNDMIVGAGVGFDLGAWTIDLQGGVGILDDRLVNAGEARAFPGRFGGGGPALHWQVTRRH
jgi:long-subunit fatty acid transport protein